MAKSKVKSDDAGRISMDDLRASINKSVGQDVAFDLREVNPTEVTQWISTGSR